MVRSRERSPHRCHASQLSYSGLMTSRNTVCENRYRSTPTAGLADGQTLQGLVVLDNTLSSLSHDLFSSNPTISEILQCPDH